MTETTDLDRVRGRVHEKVKAMTPEQRMELIRLSKPRVVEPYFKHIPHPAQQLFLLMNGTEEVMYGGSAGGGKSDALLMAALQYVDVPGYSALILRRTWPDLNSPGAILDRCRTWMAGTPAKQKEGGRIFTFPSGARIQFGYLQYDADKYKYQSSEYQFVAFDELTQFDESTYTYLFSRVRRPSVSCLNCGTSVTRVRNGSNSSKTWKHTSGEARKNCPEVYPDPAVLDQYRPAADGTTLFDVPLRMRSASNPGGVGHLWVRARFIDNRTRKKDAKFIPARLTDNPSLDQETYAKNLEHLLPVDRERLLNGDWDIEEEGTMFARHYFNVINEVPTKVQDRVRYWDLAATKPSKENKDPDWTVGCLMSHNMDGTWNIEDIVRMQARPLEVEKVIYQTAMMDGPNVRICMEQEPGSSGVNTVSHFQRNVLAGFTFKGVRSTGDKQSRAIPLSSAAQAGNVNILAANWNRDFLDEAALFPRGAHDDQVDATGGAMAEIAFGRKTRLLV